ncbi:MAG: hypothetical protein Q7T68_14705 [Sphingopyxis sp.]|nr:hypothetical protein [Sphingopyxis sp.]
MPSHKPRIIFVTYASGAFEANLDRNAHYIRRYMHADEIMLLRRRDLEADPVYGAHRDIFDAPRGAGYWAWKPWAIRRALAIAREGDVVVYQDAGFGLRYRNLLPIKALAAQARRRGFIAGVVNPSYGPNRRWNHRRCLTATGEMTPKYLDHPTVEAVISLWTTAPESLAFLDEWQRFCLDAEVIGDSQDPASEDPAFVEHRYDQAILTNLSIRHEAPTLHPPQRSLPFVKSLALLELLARSERNVAIRALLPLLLVTLRTRDRIKSR